MVKQTNPVCHRVPLFQPHGRLEPAGRRVALDLRITWFIYSGLRQAFLRRGIFSLHLRISFGVGTSSPDSLSDDLFSSPMMSMRSSTHSSQMKTVGPAMSLRTSCWLLPQNEQ